ncbi:amidohydrolase family protein [Desertivirga brevis]|uniref:amidohydrolase family protein n=1 Tax=Desertivirga brevis TaxID=2810310 RepID=UPI001A959E82|nr:amidohydrolase family protein [Pedobacter sp. SYSU D00873]
MQQRGGNNYSWILKTLYTLVFSLAFNLVSAQTRKTNFSTVSVTQGTNFSLDLSPDKKQMVIDLQGTLFILPAIGGEAKAITDGLGDDRQPSWAPNGKQIVFQSYRDGTYHLWTINADGSGLKQLTFGDFDDREPQWSANGERIIFSSDRAGNYDIWELEVSGSKLKQLTSDKADDYSPALSPNGCHFVFVSDRKEKGLYIWEDGEERPLTASKGFYAAPVFSPDGSSVLFNLLSISQSLLKKVDLQSGELQTLSEESEDVFPFRASFFDSSAYLYTSDGKIKRRSLEASPAALIPFKADLLVKTHTSYVKKKRDFDSNTALKVKGILSPAVSPDGQTVAFGALGDLWLLRAGSSKPIKITDDPAADIDVSWSPDGNSLAFVTDRSGSMNIWVYNLKDASSRQVTFYYKDALSPSWSPDSKELAFLLNDNFNGIATATVQVVNLEAGKIRQVHRSLFGPGKPSWSADGKYIVLSALESFSGRFREGINKMLLIPLDGSADRYISPLESRALAVRGKDGPVCSPNGKKLAFIQDGVLQLAEIEDPFRVTGKPRRLTSVLADSPSWTGDSKTIVFLATGVLKKVNVESGHIEDIPLNLSYTNQKPEARVVIHAGKVFDGKSSIYLKDVDITLNGNRIESIKPHSAHPSGKVIDASKKTVIPGLIEMHTHQTAGVGEVHGRNWLAYGITSVRETGTDPYDALERKEAWASGKRPGPREFFTGAMLDGKRVFYGMANSISTDQHLELELQRVGKLEYDLVKTYVRLPDDLQKHITEIAHREGIPVTSHEIYPATSYGVDGVEHIKATSRRGFSTKQSNLNKAYDDVVRLLSKSGINLTPTAALFGGFYLQFEKDSLLANDRVLNTLFSKDFIKDVRKANEARLKSNPEIRSLHTNTLKLIRVLANAGVRITPGTDSPIIPYGISYKSELKSLEEAGFSPFEVLRSATWWSAQALGIEDDLGSLEEGKVADLVVVNGDPLSNLDEVWNIENVFKNGVHYKIDELLKRVPQEFDWEK